MTPRLIHACAVLMATALMTGTAAAQGRGGGASRDPQKPLVEAIGTTEGKPLPQRVEPDA